MIFVIEDFRMAALSKNLVVIAVVVVVVVVGEFTGNDCSIKCGDFCVVLSL